MRVTLKMGDTASLTWTHLRGQVPWACPLWYLHVGALSPNSSRERTSVVFTRKVPGLFLEIKLV